MANFLSETLHKNLLKEARERNINRVLVAVSGGADSIASLFSLNQIGLKIKALHCNFHLRGDESLRDQKFVENFCDKYSIELEIKEFDIPHYLENTKGVSIEMACRNLRYDWFYKELKKWRFDRIVTGHNADDNIETLFLNMLRGAGTRGLCGMNQDNGIIWRPLLKTHRYNILNYLEENNLDFVIDSSNLGTDYRRNFLRNEIIPLLKSEWKGFNKAMDSTLLYLSEENKIIELMIKENLPPTGGSLNVETILNFPAPALLIKRFIDILGPYSTTQFEVLDAIKANKPHIRKWNLRFGTLILRNNNLSIEMSHRERCS